MNTFQFTLICLLIISLAVAVQSGCSTCGGVVPRTYTPASWPFFQAIPCYQKAAGTTACYLCLPDGTTLLGPAGNQESTCDGSECDYMTPNYTPYYAQHPCMANNPATCNSAGACSVSNLGSQAYLNWTWPATVDVACACTGRRRDAQKVVEKQISPYGNGWCPYGVIPQWAFIDASQVNHSINCPAISGGVGGMNYPGGGNCALCDGTEGAGLAFANGATYQLPANTCWLANQYGTILLSSSSSLGNTSSSALPFSSLGEERKYGRRENAKLEERGGSASGSGSGSESEDSSSLAAAAAAATSASAAASATGSSAAAASSAASASSATASTSSSPRSIQVFPGTNYPCMGCHLVQLLNGTEVCATHISKDDLCYCNVLSLSSCAEYNIIGQPTDKICATWNWDDSLMVLCITEVTSTTNSTYVGNLPGGVASNCVAGTAFSPCLEDCACNQCSGEYC